MDLIEKHLMDEWNEIKWEGGSPVSGSHGQGTDFPEGSVIQSTQHSPIEGTRLPCNPDIVHSLLIIFLYLPTVTFHIDESSCLQEEVH